MELSDKEQVDIFTLLFSHVIRHKVHSGVGLHPETFNLILTSRQLEKHRHARRARVIFLNSKVMKIVVFK